MTPEEIADSWSREFNKLLIETLRLAFLPDEALEQAVFAAP